VRGAAQAAVERAAEQKHRSSVPWRDIVARYAISMHKPLVTTGSHGARRGGERESIDDELTRLLKFVMDERPTAHEAALALAQKLFRYCAVMVRNRN
jgi:hypothetical protein